MKNVKLNAIMVMVVIILALTIDTRYSLISLNTEHHEIKMLLNQPTHEPTNFPSIIIPNKASVNVKRTTPIVIDNMQEVVAKEIFTTAYSKYVATDKEELLALSVVIYCEARGESWTGIASVADTVRNRMTSNLFPNTYEDVITQHRQFSCIKHPTNLFKDVRIASKPDAIMFRKIINLADRTINGQLSRMTTNALFYHTINVSPGWAKSYAKLGRVGNHIFYTTNKL